MLTGREPDGIIVPMKTTDLVEEGCQQSIAFALAMQGVILDNHCPRHPIFNTCITLEERSIVVKDPIRDALTVYTDASGQTQKYGYTR